MPHSEICGSRPVSGFPQLFAAVHVLHRFSLPRHPPCALCSLTVPLRHASSSHTGFELRISFARSLASIRTLYRYRYVPISMSFPIQLSVIREEFRRTPRKSLSSWPARTFRGGKSLTRVFVSLFRGAGRDRTDDLRLAKPALSQLSYSPDTRGRRLASAQASQWARAELNCRPYAYQAYALTT